MDNNPTPRMSLYESTPKHFQNNLFDRRDHQFMLQQTIKEEPSLNYCYYVNACFNLPSIFTQNGNGAHQTTGSQTRSLPVSNLKEALTKMNLTGHWEVQETALGLVMSFESKEDTEEVFNKMEIAKVLGGPVQVATLPNLQTGSGSRGDNRKNVGVANNFGRYNQMPPRNYISQCPKNRLLQPPGPLIIRDVPWSITLEEIRTSLYKQGIQLSAIERWRQHVRIEVKNYYVYERLIAEGLNFYNSGRFGVTGERPGSSGSGYRDQQTGSGSGQQDDVLQCYRCQGFWHVAASCRHLPRCVRCGEPHGVEYCTRARGNPLCCNCSGAHHAAYKNCPVRKSMAQAAPIAFVLSRDRPTGSFAEVTTSVGDTKPRCML